MDSSVPPTAAPTPPPPPPTPAPPAPCRGGRLRAWWRLTRSAWYRLDLQLARWRWRFVPAGFGRVLAAFLAIAASAAVFWQCYAIYTQDNGFPLAYHPDEQGKLTQIIENQRDFHQPLLLIETSAWVLDYLAAPARRSPGVQEELTAARARVAELRQQVEAARQEQAAAQAAARAARQKLEAARREAGGRRAATQPEAAQRVAAAQAESEAAAVRYDAARKHLDSVQKEAGAAERALMVAARAAAALRAETGGRERPGAPGPGAKFARAEPLAAVQVGRQVSAAFAAAAVAALVLAGYVLAGWAGLVLSAVTVGLCAPLIPYAHFMTEDTALLLGVAVTVLGVAGVSRWPSFAGQAGGAALLALGVALAVSGKYLGVTTLALAVPALLWTPLRGRWTLLAVGALALLGALAAGLGHFAAVPAHPAWMLGLALAGAGVAVLWRWRTFGPQCVGMGLLAVAAALLFWSGAAPAAAAVAATAPAAAPAALPAAQAVTPAPLMSYLTAYTWGRGGACAAAWALLLVPGLLLSPLRERWARLPVRLLVFVPYAVVLVAALNFQVFADYPQLEAAVAVEQGYVSGAHAGLVLAHPGRFFVGVVGRDCTVPVLLGAVVYLLMLALGWRQRTPGDWLLPAFAAGFLVVLSFCTIPFGRYALPVVVLACFFAAMGGARLVQWLAPRGWVTLPATAVLALVFASAAWPRCETTRAQIRDDSRTQLRAWAIEHLPPGTEVLQDRYAALQGEPDRRRWPTGGELSARVLTEASGFAADFAKGDFGMLREQGVQYVVVAESAYGRFYRPDLLRPGADAGPRAQTAARRAWYDRLFDPQEAELVWQAGPARPLGWGTFVNPGIRVYRVK